MDSHRTLGELIDEAGFRTRAAFARAAGLKDYEVSRICSTTAGRAPTGPQLRKIARALERPVAEIASQLLPAGHIEQEALADVIAERDELVAELGTVRGELVEVTAQLQASHKCTEDLGRQASQLQQENERLVEDAESSERKASEAVERQRSCAKIKATLEVEITKLQGTINELHSTLAEVKLAAAKDLARVDQEVQAAYAELGRERAAGIRRLILGGTLGAMAGAVIRGGAGGRRSDGDFEEDDD